MRGCLGNFLFLLAFPFMLLAWSILSLLPLDEPNRSG